MKHRSSNYGFPVMTKQETEMALFAVSAIEELRDGSVINVNYSSFPNVEQERETSTLLTAAEKPLKRQAELAL